MSASQDKKKRQLQREEGVDKRTAAQRQEDEKRRKEKKTWIAWGTVIGVLVILLLILNTNLFYAGLPSVTVSGEKYNNAQFGYFYQNAYQNMVNELNETYGESLTSYFIDTSAPLDEQQCIFQENTTWDEYFRQQAIDNIKQVTALYEAAVAAGYTLSEEDAAAIDASMENAAAAAKYYGLASVDKYMAAMYGKGATEKMARALMEKSYIASAYSNDMYESFEYGADELEAHYQEKADNFDVFTYEYYLVSAEKVEVPIEADPEATADPAATEDPEATAAPTTKTEVTDETMADAKETAEAVLAAVGEEQDFAEAVTEIAGGTATSASRSYGSNISGDMGTWLKDAARKPGDTTVIEAAGSGWYAVHFIARDDNHYNTVSVRHILVKAEDADGDEKFSASEIAAARLAAQDLYDQWKAGDMTEESFAALVADNSDDAGSVSNGGLYEDVYRGQMTEEFNDFCFAEDRKPGDTGIVFNQDNNYTGYHIMYFVGEGGLYSDQMAENSLRSEEFNAWAEELFAGYEAKINGFVMWFSGKA